MTKYDLGPVKLPVLSRNSPPDQYKINQTWACDPIENQYLVSSQLKKTHEIDELYAWAHITDTWYRSVDILIWQVSTDHNMNVQYQIYAVNQHYKTY